MKKKIQNLIILGICLIVIIVFCVLFFEGDNIESMCLKECENTGAIFINYKISQTYNFTQCICSLEGESKTLYFDLNTKEKLTNQDILGRVIS